jgi:hypothetical protein
MELVVEGKSLRDQSRENYQNRCVPEVMGESGREIIRAMQVP